MIEEQIKEVKTPTVIELTKSMVEKISYQLLYALTQSPDYEIHCEDDVAELISTKIELYARKLARKAETKATKRYLKGRLIFDSSNGSYKRSEPKIYGRRK